MNGEDTYLTVEKPAEGSYKDKGSRFLAFIHPIQSENEVKDILSSLKTKYHDARHHCYAYALGLHRDTFRAVDDGEPSSTAGKPILGQIIANNLTNVLIVVVRYFGGIKLGVPGLIQAYRQASADAISNASIIQRTEDITLHLQFPYAAINDVKYLCLETRRYKLPSFTFRFADTQILYMAMTETYDRQAGLEALTQIFEIDYTPHCAADDAYATMRIAQEMCERDKCTLPELLKKYSIRFGKIENYQFNNSSSNRRNEYLREKSREKRERGEKRARFNDFVYGYRVRPQSQELRGKRFSFSRSIEEEFALAKRLVKEIVKRGGKYSLKLSGCNAFVEREGDDSVRRNAAYKMRDEGKITDIYTLGEFERLYATQENDE